jgi:hypothetical protein
LCRVSGEASLATAAIGASATAEALEVIRERRLSELEAKPGLLSGDAFAVTGHLAWF